MSGWMCQTPGCGHNRSAHRDEWNKFRGERNTSCTAQSYGIGGSERCRCNEFSEVETKEVVK
jgi:hypothetical protein